MVYAFDLNSQHHETLYLMIFVFVVMAIDVAHVHATIFRVYLDKEEFLRRKVLYAGLPILVFLVAMVIYQAGEIIFWRIFAYLAVLHFIRQQYGFVALYNHKANLRQKNNLFLQKYGKALNRLDKYAVYIATLYPLLYWHAKLPRQFYWFMEGDFIEGFPQEWLIYFTALYFLFFFAYLLLRLYLIFFHQDVNIGKDVTMLATVLTWYIGIVAFDIDTVFTITNVVIHGIAYMALVRFVALHNQRLQKSSWRRVIINHASIFFLFLFAIAFAEEFLWDNLAWFDHTMLFGGWLQNWQGLDWLMQITVPLLSVPQVTHYILDGFIWKFNEEKNPGLKKTVVG